MFGLGHCYGRTVLYLVLSVFGTYRYLHEIQACVKRHFVLETNAIFLKACGTRSKRGALDNSHNSVWDIYDVEVVQLTPRGRRREDNTLPDYY